jgi:chaperonin GroEL
MKQFKQGSSLNQAIVEGVNILADNVSATLGPRGRTVAMFHKEQGIPVISKDGVTIADFVDLEDPFQNLGAQIIKQAAKQTVETAGDGTTTSTVLARAILNEGQKYITSGVSPVELKRGIDKAVEAIADKLEEFVKPIETAEDIKHIATISANNDVGIGTLISTAVDKAGKDGAVLVEEARSNKTSLHLIEGFRFDSGYSSTSNQFINNERAGSIDYEDVIILVTDEAVSSVEQIMPTLQLAARDRRPLRDVQLNHLGQSKKINILKGWTTIIGGKGDQGNIEDRIEAIKTEIMQTEDLHECERLQDRITRLASGIAVIRVGAATEVEMIEKKHRIDDALEAVRSAQEEGIVPGGGVALLRAVTGLSVTTDNEEQDLGAQIVLKACEAPLRTMARNAGESEDIIIERVRNGQGDEGYDFLNRCMVSTFETGIIDPKKVTRCALENAASAAGTLLTTSHAIVKV